MLGTLHWPDLFNASSTVFKDVLRRSFDYSTYVRKEYKVIVESIPMMDRLNPTYVMISRTATSFSESYVKKKKQSKAILQLTTRTHL